MYEFSDLKLKQKRQIRQTHTCNGPLHQVVYHHVNNVNNLSGLNKITWQDAKLKNFQSPTRNIHYFWRNIILLSTQCWQHHSYLSLLVPILSWVGQLMAWRPHVWYQSSGRQYEGQHISLSHLAEFQTPTVFDHDFDLHHSIFYNAPKIVKIIIYILYIHRKVSTI